jgi:hypothetical protein
MNTLSNPARPGGSIPPSNQSLEALMYAATVGIAIVGAVSVSLAEQTQESHGHVVAARDAFRCPVGGMCRWPAGQQTAARTLANTPLDAQRKGSGHPALITENFL